jgi:hypothetical protein
MPWSRSAISSATSAVDLAAGALQGDEAVTVAVVHLGELPRGPGQVLDDVEEPEDPRLLREPGQEAL